ncbi:ModE family transcriptional regulator [Novosphingobium sp. RD2P27]|uniref:ModE family transcriptional regulator n=1 Tax=Novosphingobium kalidii TaxID=3230299 RepID=A0ABV2CY88_9SPHN
MASETGNAVLKLKAQVLVGDTIALGPGKAALLEAIDREGSIAAAGRSLGLSYRRTRDMIDVLNASWQAPLVYTVKGGQRGGGTSLTPRGLLVLERYRALEAVLEDAASRYREDLLALATTPT